MLHQQCQLLLRLIPLLICRVGHFNDPRHVLTLFLKLLLQTLVDVVKYHFLASKTVDLVTQLFVGEDSFIELGGGFVEAGFKDFDLLGNLGVAVVGTVGAFETSFLVDDLLLEGLDFVIHTLLEGFFFI